MKESCLLLNFLDLPVKPEDDMDLMEDDMDLMEDDMDLMEGDMVRGLTLHQVTHSPYAKSHLLTKILI